MKTQRLFIFCLPLALCGLGEIALGAGDTTRAITIEDLNALGESVEECRSQVVVNHDGIANIQDTFDTKALRALESLAKTVGDAEGMDLLADLGKPIASADGILQRVDGLVEDMRILEEVEDDVSSIKKTLSSAVDAKEEGSIAHSLREVSLILGLPQDDDEGHKITAKGNIQDNIRANQDRLIKLSDSLTALSITVAGTPVCEPDVLQDPESCLIGRITALEETMDSIHVDLLRTKEKLDHVSDMLSQVLPFLEALYRLQERA